MLENTIVKSPEMTLAGVSLRTTNAEEKGPNGRLPGSGKRTFKVKLRPRLMRIIPILSMLYIRIMKAMQQAHTPFLSGMKRRAIRFSQKQGFEHAFIPESTYMVFTTKKGPVYDVVLQAWEYIWQYFQESPEKRTFTGDYELYDNRNFDPSNAEVQIYIAIQ